MASDWLHMVIPLKPVAKQRARVSRYGSYTPTKTKNFETALARCVKTLWGKAPLEGPLQVVVRFVFQPPKRKTRQYPCVGDTDNYLKSVCDGLNGVLWSDDVQIVDLRGVKLYAMDGSPERIELEIREIQSDNSA